MNLIFYEFLAVIAALIILIIGWVFNIDFFIGLRASFFGAILFSQVKKP